MKKALIIPNLNNDKEHYITTRVVEKLTSVGITCYIDDWVAKIDRAIGYHGLIPDCDMVIVIGGDGSVIDASKYAVEMDIPLLGVNLGKVGYLTEVEPDLLSVLERLAEGEYRIVEKMLLCAQKGEEVIDRLAVNDVVISHESYLGIADFWLSDSNQNSLRYRADGIILSTPQGSTAYSLSAGGPVMAHNVEGIIATAVCPHSFFDRSVVFDSGEMLSVSNGSDSNLNISIDGRLVGALLPGESCTVSKAEKKLKMITFQENNMFSNLFRKMKILEDIK